MNGYTYRATISIACRYIIHVTMLPCATLVNSQLHAQRMISVGLLIGAGAVTELAHTVLLELRGPQPQQGSGLSA